MAPEIQEEGTTRRVEPAAPSEFEYVEKLSREIDKFEQNLAALSTRLRPVLVSYPETLVETGLDVAPHHEFHALIQRFATVNDTLDGLIGRVRL